MNIAYVLVQSTIGHEMEVLNDLLKIEADSEKEVEKIITKKVRKVKNVNTTTTLSVISEQEKL